MIQFLFNAFSLTKCRMSSRKSACLYESRVIILYYYHPNYTLENFVVLLPFLGGFSVFQECDENALLSAQRSGSAFLLAVGPVRSAPVFSYEEQESVFKVKPLEESFSTLWVYSHLTRLRDISLALTYPPIHVLLPLQSLLKFYRSKIQTASDEMFFFITSDKKMFGSACGIMAR